VERVNLLMNKLSILEVRWPSANSHNFPGLDADQHRGELDDLVLVVIVVLVATALEVDDLRKSGKRSANKFQHFVHPESRPMTF
jgi:hypothetical protein